MEKTLASTGKDSYYYNDHKNGLVFRKWNGTDELKENTLVAFHSNFVQKSEGNYQPYVDFIGLYKDLIDSNYTDLYEWGGWKMQTVNDYKHGQPQNIKLEETCIFKLQNVTKQSNGDYHFKLYSDLHKRRPEIRSNTAPSPAETADDLIKLSNKNNGTCQLEYKFSDRLEIHQNRAYISWDNGRCMKQDYNGHRDHLYNYGLFIATPPDRIFMYDTAARGDAPTLGFPNNGHTETVTIVKEGLLKKLWAGIGSWNDSTSYNVVITHPNGTLNCGTLPFSKRSIQGYDNSHKKINNNMAGADLPEKIYLKEGDQIKITIKGIHEIHRFHDGTIRMALAGNGIS